MFDARFNKGQWVNVGPQARTMEKWNGEEYDTTLPPFAGRIVDVFFDGQDVMYRVRKDDGPKEYMVIESEIQA